MVPDFAVCFRQHHIVRMQHASRVIYCWYFSPLTWYRKTIGTSTSVWGVQMEQTMLNSTLVPSLPKWGGKSGFSLIINSFCISLHFITLLVKMWLQQLERRWNCQYIHILNSLSLSPGLKAISWWRCLETPAGNQPAFQRRTYEIRFLVLWGIILLCSTRQSRVPIPFLNLETQRCRALPDNWTGHVLTECVIFRTGA